MRALALLLLGVAACYSPSYRDCEITCAGGSCPSGFTCDQGVCRTNGFTTVCGSGSGTDARGGDGNGVVDASLFGDPDMDGVQYPGDNCPTKANPDQFDEDGDGMGDDCDPCPPFNTMADNKDSDGDGVGDGCDPSPITAGNSILAFAGFRAGTSGGVPTPMGDWSIGNGQAGALGTSAPNTPLLMTWQLPANSTAETVLAHYKLTSIGTSRPDGAGIVTQWDPANMTGIVCWIGFETTSNVGNLKLFPNGQAPLGIANDTFAVNNFYAPNMTRRGDALSCSEKNAVTALNSQVTVTGTTAGVIVKDVDVAFDWVLIVGGP